MRFFHVALVLAILLAAIPAHGGQPADSLPPKSRPSKEMVDSLRETRARLRFAPMWMPVPKFARDPKAAPNPAPSVAAYAIIWQPQWQEELGLSAEQKKSLMVINGEATAESKKQADEFQKLSPEEKKTQVKAWAGKSSPARRQLENTVHRQIEAILTPQQLKTINDNTFPEQVVGLLYDAKVRQEIHFTPDQEAQFRQVAKERLARFQEMSLNQAEKLWGMLTSEQQTAFREVVKHQGPTSAALSIAWELGFSSDNAVAGYPMLAETPVRKRLGLSTEQEKQLDAIVAEAAPRERARERQMLGEAPPESDLDRALWEEKAKKRVEAILAPEQLATLNEIDFRRRVVLAFGYPEKRKSADITEQQVADYEQLVKSAHKPMYEMDREMLGRAVEILTSAQKDKLHAIMNERFGW